MNRFRTVVFVFALLALPLIASAQKGKPKPSPSPTPVPAVVSARFDFCPDGDTDCELANRVRQDADRAYTNGQEGVAISTSTGTTGSIVIDLERSTRTVVYDLRDRVHMGSPQPTWTSSPQNFKVQFNVHDAYVLRTTGMCATSATCEADMVSAMNGGFYIGKVRYRFQWNPGSVLQYINWAEPTSPVHINYVRSSAGETWTVTPIAEENSYYLAGMQVESGGRNITFGGQYNMPFVLVITAE